MIIGISGKKQHGKDTTADIIQYLICKHKGALTPYQDNYFHEFRLAPRSNEIQSGWIKKQFAAKLKQIVALLIGCTVEQLEDNDFKEKPLGPEWNCFYIYSPRLDHLFSPPYLTKEEAERNMRSMGIGVEDELTVVEESLTPRKLLQLVGTECGRQIIHPNIWINATIADYHDNPSWIITDVRFPNEAQAIKDKGGLIIRVHRPSIQSYDKHESEVALDGYTGFDSTIMNSESIEGLINQVHTFLHFFNIIK